MPPTGKLTLQEALEEIERLKADKQRQDDVKRAHLEERVDKVEDLISKVYLQNEQQSTMLKQIKATTESVSVSIHGTPEDASKGMVLRLDRLEQKQKTSDWVSKTALGAVITAIIAWILALFQSGGK